MPKFLVNIDLNQNEIQNVSLQKLATAPSSPTKGQIYYNTIDNRSFCWNGNSWVGMDSFGSTMSAENIVTAINGSTFLIDDDNLSTNVNDAISKAHNTHAISDVSGLQTALDGKVDDSQVLTDVPANAKFTDTVTTINGKTGVIAKADIVALGIPAQDTNTTYEVFSTTANGLVPKTTTSNTTDYLRKDGTWATPPDTKYTLPIANGTTIGGIKSGTDITIDASGNVSVNDDSHNHVISNVDGLQNALDSKETPAGATSKASTAENNAKAYTDTKIADLVDSSPSTLDTLNELAQALGDDPNFATTITNELAKKTDKYSQSIGDGSATSIVVTHNLNTRDVVITLRETASPYSQVITDVEFTSVNTITLKFAVAPISNQYTVTIIG